VNFFAAGKAVPATVKLLQLLAELFYQLVELFQYSSW
jgi:hypothetical protein